MVVKQLTFTLFTYLLCEQFVQESLVVSIVGKVETRLTLEGEASSLGANIPIYVAHGVLHHLQTVKPKSPRT